MGAQSTRGLTGERGSAARGHGGREREKRERQEQVTLVLSNNGGGTWHRGGLRQAAQYSCAGFPSRRPLFKLIFPRSTSERTHHSLMEH